MEIYNRKPKWLYRIESRDPENGLWYDSKGKYVWGCRDCKGDAKFLPMGHDERYHVDGNNWFSACSNKEDLLHWYTLEDALDLIENNNFVFTRYLARDYIEYPTHETVFLKDTALKREEIDIRSLFGITTESLKEARLNVHQQHIESLVFAGPKGLAEINNYIKLFLNRISNKAKGGLNLTTKIDGSPAVIMWSKMKGYPKKSISLKSFVNNANNALSSEEDIDAKYGDRPEMAAKLKYCLELAKHIPADEAWQGDCLYTKEDLKEIEVNGTRYLTFQPNKIIYAFTEDNETYETIKNTDFGIAFHTIYTKSGKDKFSQSFDVDVERLNVPDNIYVMSPVINVEDTDIDTADIAKKYNLLKLEEGKILNSNAYIELVNNEAFSKYWAMFENKNISDKRSVVFDTETFYDDLVDYVNDTLKSEYDTKYASLKTDRGREAATSRYEAEVKDLAELLHSHKDVIIQCGKIFNIVADIKMDLWDMLRAINPGYNMFYNSRTKGYIPAESEGIAMSDADGNIVKIVDRTTFSANNRSSDIIGGWERESLTEAKYKEVDDDYFDDSWLYDNDGIEEDNVDRDIWYKPGIAKIANNLKNELKNEDVVIVTCYEVKDASFDVVLYYKSWPEERKERAAIIRKIENTIDKATEHGGFDVMYMAPGKEEVKKYGADCSVFIDLSDNYGGIIGNLRAAYMKEHPLKRHVAYTDNFNNELEKRTGVRILFAAGYGDWFNRDERIKFKYNGKVYNYLDRRTTSKRELGYGSSDGGISISTEYDIENMLVQDITDSGYISREDLYNKTDILKLSAEYLDKTGKKTAYVIEPYDYDKNGPKKASIKNSDNYVIKELKRKLAEDINESLTESKADLQAFVDKFGPEIYDEFMKAKQRFKNKGVSVDLTYHIKHTSPEEMRNLLINTTNTFSNDGDLKGPTKVRGKYGELGEHSGYLMFKPNDYLSSMDLSFNTGWCTGGRYGHYGEKNFTPNEKAAKEQWTKHYEVNREQIFYLLDKDTREGKYAIVIHPNTFPLNVERKDGTKYTKSNFEIYNAEDRLDYYYDNVDKLSDAIEVAGKACNRDIILESSKQDEELEEYYSNLDRDELLEWVQSDDKTEEQRIKDFKDQVIAHHNLVNEFAAKIGKNYPQHDFDKLEPEAAKNYSFITLKTRTPEQQELLDRATAHHIKINPHHHEHWDSNFDEASFGRHNVQFNIDCTKMPEEAIDEMCCDWCAVAKKFNSQPYSWFTKNCIKGNRWIFTEDQQKYIWNKLNELWKGERKVEEDMVKQTKETVVAAFGRFNPTTIGHLKLFRVLDKVAKEKDGDALLYLSHVQDKKNNPLSYESKVEWAQRAIDAKGLNIQVVKSNAKTPIYMAAELYNAGYKNLVFVCGADRFDEISTLLNNYNGVNAKDDMYFKFNTIEIINAGERDELSTDAETKASGTLVRQYAKEDNFEEFKKLVPFSDENATDLFNELKIAYGLTEQLKEDDDQKTDKLYNRKLNTSVDSISAAYDMIQSEINRLNIDNNIKREINSIINNVEVLTNSIDIGQLDTKKVMKFMNTTHIDLVTSLVQFIKQFDSPDELARLVSKPRTLKFGDGNNIRADALKILSEKTVDNLSNFRPSKNNVNTGIGEVLIATIYRGGALPAPGEHGDVTIGGVPFEVKADQGVIGPFRENKLLYDDIRKALIETGARGSKGNIGSGVRSNFKNEPLTAKQINRVNRACANLKVSFKNKATQLKVFDKMFTVALKEYLKHGEQIILIKGDSKNPRLDKSVIINRNDTPATLEAKGVSITFSDNRNNGNMFKITLK